MPDPSLAHFEDDDPDRAEGSAPAEPDAGDAGPGEPGPGSPGTDSLVAGEPQWEEPGDESPGDPSLGDPSPVRNTPAHPAGNGNGKRGASSAGGAGPAGFEYEPFEIFAAGEYENPEEAALPDLEAEWMDGGWLERATPEGAWLEEPEWFEDLITEVISGADFIRQATLEAYQGSARPGKAASSRGELRLPPLLERRIDTRSCSAGMLEELELMQVLVNAAAQAHSGDEAAACAAAMVPGAVRLAPGFSRGLWPAVPALIAGVRALARLFYAEPSYGGRAETAQRMALIPAILVETVAHLARICAQNEPVAQQAPAVLAQQVSAVLKEAKLAGKDQPGRSPSGGRHGRGG